MNKTVLQNANSAMQKIPIFNNIFIILKLILIQKICIDFYFFIINEMLDQIFYFFFI